MKKRLMPFAVIVGTLACLVLVIAGPVLPLWSVGDPVPRWWSGLQLGLWIYLGFFLTLAAVCGWFGREKQGGWARGTARAFWWIRLWHGWVGLIVVAGAIAGLFLFPLGGTVFGVDLPLSRLLRAGLRDGAFYALIWGPGISLVICFMHAYESAKASNKAGNSAGPST